jgi:hypothetical protein
MAAGSCFELGSRIKEQCGIIRGQCLGMLELSCSSFARKKFI